MDSNICLSQSECSENKVVYSIEKPVQLNTDCFSSVAEVLTKVPDVPHGVDGGVMFIEHDKKWRGGDAVCQCVAVKILPGKPIGIRFIH